MPRWDGWTLEDLRQGIGRAADAPGQIPRPRDAGTPGGEGEVIWHGVLAATRGEGE